MNASQTESIGLRRVLAINLLDIPYSRNRIISFALIFLAMVAVPSFRSLSWQKDRTEGQGVIRIHEQYDTEPTKRLIGQAIRKA